MTRARRYELTPTRQQRRARRLRQVTLALAGVIALVRVVLVTVPATAATPLLAHQASASGFPAGSPIFDFATLGNGANPTGTITFLLYEPGDTTCSNPVSTTSVPVNGNGNYQSPSFTTNRAGVYQYVAQYSGDANNDPVATACGDPAGQVTMGKRVPTFSTQASPTVPTNGQVTDTATLGSGSGPNGPTGTITFNLYGPLNLTCTPPAAFTSTVPVSGNGQYTSAPFTPTQAGTYQWIAQYSGDADNVAASTICVDPAESVIVTPGGLITPTLVTTASPSVAVGGQVSDSATLSGGTLPTGSITFTLYGPDDATCAGAPAFTSAPIAVNGNGQYDSGPFTTTAAGTFRWRATYTGDVTHNAVSTACNDANESVVVTAGPGPVTPTLVTTASPTVTVGEQVLDVANLAGGNNPTGTITFTLYGPDDATCAATPAFTSAPVTVNGNGQYASGPFTTTQAGTFQWVAQYSGDANNNAVTTACNDPNESVVVTAGPGPVTPTLVTTASPTVTVGEQVLDVANLAGGNNPTGTITFTLYGPDDATCAATPAFTSAPVTVNGNGQYASGPFTTTQAGTFRWVAQYSGDANNNAVTTACNDPNESVVVTAGPGPVTPTIVTTASPTVAVGGQVTDTATLSGGNNPTGTITFNLFGPDDATCAGPTAFINNQPVSGNGQYTSGPFTTTEAGTFRWRAGYSGDANNNPVSTACNDADESVVVTPASTSSTSSSTSSSSTSSTSSSTTSSSTSSTSSTSTSSTSSSTSTSSTSTSSTSTSTTSTSTTTSSTTTTTTPPPGDTTTTSTSTTTTSTTTPGGTQGTTTTTGGPGLVAATSTTAAPTAPSVQVNPNQGTAGQQVVLSGSGFGSNDALTATFNSDPVVVATFRANAAGAFSVTIRIPADATPGLHTIVVTGASGRSASAGFTVLARSVASPAPTPTSPLARTGSALRDPLSAAAVLLVLGNCALLSGKRRRNR